MVNIKVGDKAPDFTLPETETNSQSLNDFLGKKVVLAFFVTAFTATCTKEACRFRDSMSRLINLEAQVVGISVNDITVNRKFVEKNRLAFPVLSDYNGEVLKAYGLTPVESVGIDGQEFVKRSVVILDKEGIVRYVWVANSEAVEPNYDEIQAELEKI
jgi:glutaredoxin-dependent peroxiredoxin